ncbi:MAG TPA: hypothetical protein VGR16_15215, partial [Thermomicrobiales bacterium]|nr:hypothetical protein [Thermomicrobiales bacterium]
MNDEGSPSTTYRPIEDQGAGFPAATGERQASASPRVLTSWHIAFFTSLTMLVAVSAFAVGLIVERSVFRNASPLSVVTDNTPYDQVAEMARLLQNEYYFRPVTEEEREAFSQELEYAAVDGMTSTLDDPYTTFLPPVEAGPAADHLEGEFGGIGVHIQY